MKLVFAELAWEDYLYWQKQDRKMVERINKLIRDEAGATAIEYGLIAALIAVAAITAMQGLGNQLKTTFNKTATEMAKSN